MLCTRAHGHSYEHNHAGTLPLLITAFALVSPLPFCPGDYPDQARMGTDTSWAELKEMGSTISGLGGAPIGAPTL